MLFWENQLHSVPRLQFVCNYAASDFAFSTAAFFIFACWTSIFGRHLNFQKYRDPKGLRDTPWLIWTMPQLGINQKDYKRKDHDYILIKSGIFRLKQHTMFPSVRASKGLYLFKEVDLGCKSNMSESYHKQNIFVINFNKLQETYHK